MSLVFEIIHNCKGVGKQPLDAFGVDHLPLMAPFKGLFGAAKCFVEEMIQAELFGS